MSLMVFGATRALTFVLKPLSPQSADEVEIQAGQRRADLVHGAAYGEGSEVDGDQSGAVNQLYC